MTIRDIRSEFWVSARDGLEAAQKLGRAHLESQRGKKDPEDPDTLPVQYWANIAEAHIFATLASAPIDVMYAAIGIFEERERLQAREDEQYRASFDALFERGQEP